MEQGLQEKYKKSITIIINTREENEYKDKEINGVRHD